MICQGVTDVYNCHHNTLELNGNWIVAFKMPPNIFHKLNSNTPLKRQLYCGSIHTLSSKLVASLVDGFLTSTCKMNTSQNSQRQEYGFVWEGFGCDEVIVRLLMHAPWCNMLLVAGLIKCNQLLPH